MVLISFIHLFMTSYNDVYAKGTSAWAKTAKSILKSIFLFRCFFHSDNFTWLAGELQKWCALPLPAFVHPLEILEYLWLETSNLLRSLQTVGSQDVALYFLVAQVMPVQWTWTMKKSRALWVFLAWKGAARGNIPGKKVLLKACSKNIYGQSFLLMCYCRH